MRKISVGLLMVFLSGCAIFNPYNDNFTCPKTFNGKCVSPTSAYQESLEGGGKEEEGPLKSGKEKGVSLTEASYQSALYEKLTGLLREPTTPMIAPPQVMRVLILPYKGEGARLYMPRYVYILVEEPKWVLGNQWLDEETRPAGLLPQK